MKLTQIIVASLLMLSITANLAVAQQRKSELKLGVINPMTGDWKLWGDRIRDALELFRENHSFPDKFIYQDEGTCDSKRAVSAYKYLRAVHDVRIIVVGCLNGARAILPEARRENVLLLSPGFQEMALFSTEGPLINFALQVDSEAFALAHLIEQSKISKLAIVRNEGVEDFIQGLSRGFTQEKQVDIVVDESLPTEEQNFGPFLAKTKSLEADGLFALIGEAQLISLLKLTAAQRYSGKVFSGYAAETLAISNPELRELLNGVLFTYPKINADTAEFEKAFEAKFKQKPTVNSYFATDALTELLAAVRNCPDSSANCLFKKIADGSTRNGLSGKYTIAKDGSITRDFGFKQFTKDGIRILE